jgi:hypothetical protein
MHNSSSFSCPNSPGDRGRLCSEDGDDDESDNDDEIESAAHTKRNGGPRIAGFP